MRATMEVHHLFLFLRFLNLDGESLLPKTDLEGEKKKESYYRTKKKNSHGLRTRRESCKKNGLLFFCFPTIFGQERPVIQKAFQTKTATPVGKTNKKKGAT